MAFTANELVPINQALGRIGSLRLLISDITSSQYLQATLYYGQTRDALLRSFEWYWAGTKTDLVLIKTLTLAAAPTPAIFVVGAILTSTSGVTCKVLEVISSTVYVVAYLSGTFVDGEDITDDSIVTNTATGSTGFPTVIEDVPTDTHWKHQYQLPTDLLRILTEHHRHHWHHFAIEGKRLYTNHDRFRLHYIRYMPNPLDWDVLFTEVLVLALALKMLPALSGTAGATLYQTLQLELKQAMARARSVCSVETNNTGYSSWNLARYGSGKVYPLDPTRIS